MKIKMKIKKKKKHKHNIKNQTKKSPTVGEGVRGIYIFLISIFLYVFKLFAYILAFSNKANYANCCQ